MSIEAMKQDFETWWYNEGSKGPDSCDPCDLEEHCKRMCEIAWSNGAYKAIAEVEKQYQSTADKSKLEKVKANGTLLPEAEQKPLFKTIIDQHEGLAEELAAMDSQPDTPKRTWVGLTKEEVEDIEVTWEATSEWSTFSRAVLYIEAKLKEKNT